MPLPEFRVILSAMKPFSLLIKPAGADCNLRCAYCFYLEKCGLYPDSSRHRMTPEVLERLVAGYMRTPQPNYLFSFQGGEPTLMGVEFFRQVVRLQRLHAPERAQVTNTLQTNATLIDDEFARFLAENGFLVGVSLDGPAEIHDRYRLTADGRGTHAEVLRGIECLKRARAEFNILTLVSQSNVRHGREVYRCIRDQGHRFHQYIPCVEFGPDGKPLPFAISGEEWGEFLCQVFDEWRAADTRTVSVRLFDALLAILVDGRPMQCTLDRDCRQYFVVEHNGDIYPCDFFVRPELRLGNIADTSWEAALASPLYAQFGGCKARWNPACASCDVLDLCSGDCLKHRPGTPADPSALSVLCAGWKRFLRHARPKLEALADEVRRRRHVEQQRQSGGGSAPGRNDPCPCGSGRKFKKCCGA